MYIVVSGSTRLASLGPTAPFHPIGGWTGLRAGSVVSFRSERRPFVSLGTYLKSQLFRSRIL
jgi:hypothetical protein